MIAKFADVLKIINGKNQKKVENPNGQYPIYGSGGIMGYADDFLCKANTVVIGRKGNINKPIFVDVPFWNVDTAFGLSAKEDVLLPKYLYYFCENFDFERLNTTVTIPSLTKANLLEVAINIPEIQTQYQVVSVLDKVCDLIAVRKQQLDKLDELVKARFVEMFGDIVCNDRNWPTFLLEDIADSRLGKMLDAKQQTGHYAFPYLANFNVQWFRFEVDKLNQMDFDELDQIEFALKDGDLLICEGGEVGRCAVWHNQVVPCFFQKALHRVRCNLSIVKPDYLSWWFKFHSDYNQFEDIVGSKATIAHLPGVKLKKLEIVVPPINIQAEFSLYISQIEQLKLTIQQGLDKLEMMKKALMQEYFG